MDHTIWNMHLKVSVSLCNGTTSSRVKVTQNRASYKMLQKQDEKKKQIVCVLIAFQVIYTE